MRERMPTVAGVGCLVLVGCLVMVAATSCAAPNENPLGLPTHPVVTPDDPAPSAPPSPVPPSPATAGATSSGAAPPAIALVGTLSGSARGHEDVVQAVAAYMAVRVAIGNAWTVDDAALYRVATGRAAREAARRAETMRSRGLRVVGEFEVNASAVEMVGDQATVTGCMVDRTSEVNAAGVVYVDPPGGRLATMTLQRDGGRWRVSDVPRETPPFCSTRGA